MKEKANIIIAPEKGFADKKGKNGKIPPKSHLVYLGITILRKGNRGDIPGPIQILAIRSDTNDDELTPKAQGQNEFIVVRGRGKTNFKLTDDEPKKAPEPSSAKPNATSRMVNNGVRGRRLSEENISVDESNVTSNAAASADKLRRVSKAPPPVPQLKAKAHAPSNSDSNATQGVAVTKERGPKLGNVAWPPSLQQTLTKQHQTHLTSNEDIGDTGSPRDDVKVINADPAYKLKTGKSKGATNSLKKRFKSEGDDTPNPEPAMDVMQSSLPPLLPAGIYVDYEFLKTAGVEDGIDTKNKEVSLPCLKLIELFYITNIRTHRST